ncbi:sensor domain-containing diguanylate cyclase [Aeromonas caviae]|uniref:sensor domain-containing diguanylate cyclase n=1 Tax=Aeromonas caviae TaxID=648 RepID=UPI001FBA7F19|nr:PAS domain S-box protein [Aeromonas caviae]BDN86701.1 sensor domain-containing diguanylate cyclase [Aeromonas caviae]GKR34415.1 sensor domain-containing diguanylate cyclase [Aeromonas caviae]
MIAPPLPRDEHSRLERLRILGLLDHEPIDQLDRLTRLITRHFALPIAMVSLTDVNRQWFLARTGVDMCEINREHSFCGHAILRPDIMQVPDARRDLRFADNPLVTDDPGVVFYAGRPLRALDGVVLGTLCLVDHVPRHLDEDACRDLDDFGRLVENTLHDLERRHQVRTLNQVLEDKEHLFTLTFNQSSVGMALSSLEGKWLRANPGLERLLGYSEHEMLSRTWLAMTHPEDLQREQPLFDALIAGQRQDYRLEKRMIRADGTQCWVQLSVTLCQSRTMAPHMIAVFADLTERKQAEAELVRLQQGLEQQVQSRTRELSRTVEQLHQEMRERGAMQQQLWQEQRRLQHMLEHTSNAFLELDANFIITGWNPASTTLLGWHADEMLGRPLFGLLGAEHPLLSLSGNPQSPPRRLECDIITRTGRHIPVEVIAERYQFDGKVRIALFLHDITARRQVLAEIERGRARLRAITDGLPVTISMVSPEGRYLFANQAYCRYFGLDTEQMREMSVRDVIGEEAHGRAMAYVAKALAGEQVSFEHRFDLPIGRRDLRITMIPSRGDEPGVYILGSDITKFKALQSQLEHEAAHDPLTGLPNRRAFTLRLSRELERVRQNAEPLGLLFLDLDGFKGINDRLGHHVGDALLQRFAQVLSAEVRPGDMVARLAGDEFTIILPALRQPAQELPALCERLLAAMAVPGDVAGHRLPLAGSIGGALCHSGQYCHIDDLLHRADAAMYRAKQSGKGRFALDL